MSKISDLIVHAEEIEPYIPGGDDTYLSQCLIGPDGVGSQTLNVNMGTVKPHKRLHGGSHPTGAHEGYYILRGKGQLWLGGDPKTGEGAEVHEMRADTAVWIPGGTFHSIENLGDEELVFLTLWADHRGNEMLEVRRKAWGTTFRKKKA